MLISIVLFVVCVWYVIFVVLFDIVGKDVCDCF